MPYLINKYTGMLDTAPGSENSPMTIIPGFYLSQDLFEVMRPVLLNHTASIQDKEMISRLAGTISPTATRLSQIT